MPPPLHALFYSAIVELTYGLAKAGYMYQVDIDMAPAYELALSLAVYLDRQAYKTLDLGTRWVARVRETLDHPFVDALAALRDVPGKPVLDLLIWQCPTKRTARDFLQWLAGLSAGEIYEHIAPYVPIGVSWLPRDLGALRDQVGPLLTHWDDQYFRHIEPAILDGLCADAAAKRALLETTAPDVVVEAATSGVYVEPVVDLDRVVLVPQYHYRPWNHTQAYHRVRLFLYAVDALPSGADEPLPRLQRVTRALADDTRLRLLRFLATGPRSFSAIVAWAGIPKSTVHYHLVALRAAGLVRIHDAGRGNDTFSLRTAAVTALSHDLADFLHMTADADGTAP